jgi:hypothetical protein
MQTNSAVIDQDAETILAPEERQLCEVWTRVMGYFHERKSFLESKCD